MRIQDAADFQKMAFSMSIDTSLPVGLYWREEEAVSNNILINNSKQMALSTEQFLILLRVNCNWHCYYLHDIM